MNDLKLISKRNENHRTVITLRHGRVVGGKALFIAAGPCTIEDESGLSTIASALADLGVAALRGGAFKPRTSPYDFSGLGMTGVDMLARVGARHRLITITEVLAAEQIPPVGAQADILQVGSRNMQNFELLRALGRADKPILLKRGLAATIHEFLCAAEYLMAAGNPQVILCERGIRGFDHYTRNVLDLASVAALKELTHLPVIVDPSHATGRRELIVPMARAAVAAGADGLLVECHFDPDASISDAHQTINLSTMNALMGQIIPLATLMGRSVGPDDRHEGDPEDGKHVLCDSQERKRSTDHRPHPT